MRIEIVSSTFLPRVGGTERLLDGLIRGLKSRGHEIEVTTHRQALKIKAAYPVPIHVFWPATLFLLSRFPKIGKAYWKLQCLARFSRFKRADAILWVMIYPCGIAIETIKKFSQAKNVLRACGWDVQKQPEIGYGARCISAEVEAEISAICRSADASIANSSDTSKDFSDLGVSAEKIHLIPNGFDHRFFHRTRAERQSSTLRLVTVGRNHPKKGFDLLPEIASKLREMKIDFQWTLMGEGMNSILTLFKERGLDRDVTCISSATREQVAETLNRSDVMVFPTRIESFGLVVVEAMAAGAVVVTSNASGVADIVEDRKNGMLCPIDDASAFARAIGEIAASPELERSLRKNALETSRIYDWQHVLDRYEELLQ